MDTDLDTALLLHQVPLFAQLDPESLLPVARMSTEQSLNAGETLFAQGSFGDSLFIVIDGTLLVHRDGQQLARLGSGECVGELAALDWQPRSASVTAERASTVLRVEHNDLMDLLQEHPSLLHALIAVLSQRIRSAA